MPTVAEHRGDPLKEYGWILLVLVLFVGGWLSLSSPTGTGGDNVAIAVREDPAAEQSLRSLDSGENPSGAPGGAMEMPAGKAAGAAAGGEAGPAGASGSLYQAPGGAAGSPIPEGAGAAIEAAAKGQTAGGMSLAEALQGVADSPAKTPDNGWGGAAPRTGFAKPKAAFGQIGASRSGGAGSTSASLVTVDKAFGTGGNVALNLGPGLDAAAAQGGKLAAAAKGANLEGLKAARKASLDSLRQGDELAASKGRQSFDGGAAGKGALSQLQSAGAASGAGMGDDGGVPMNLKANDPSKTDMKKIEPPAVGEGKEVQDSSNKQYMQQQMMMMMMGMMMMGVMGPAGGQMMGMMMPMMQMGMQMQMQEQLHKDRVKG